MEKERRHCDTKKLPVGDFMSYYVISCFKQILTNFVGQLALQICLTSYVGFWLIQINPLKLYQL